MDRVSSHRVRLRKVLLDIAHHMFGVDRCARCGSSPRILFRKSRSAVRSPSIPRPMRSYASSTRRGKVAQGCVRRAQRGKFRGWAIVELEACRQGPSRKTPRDRAPYLDRFGFTVGTSLFSAPATSATLTLRSGAGAGCISLVVWRHSPEHVNSPRGMAPPIPKLHALLAHPSRGRNHRQPSGCHARQPSPRRARPSLPGRKAARISTPHRSPARRFTLAGVMLRSVQSPQAGHRRQTPHRWVEWHARWPGRSEMVPGAASTSSSRWRGPAFDVAAL